MTHMEIALREYGVKEINPGENPRIVKYSTDIGNTWVTSDDQVKWCSEFGNWCLKQAGIQGTNSGAARSFLTWGTPLTEPEFGCIVLIGDAGVVNHFTFYVSEVQGDPTKFYGLGGNQNDSVNITTFSKSRVISYRKVPKVDQTAQLEKIIDLQKQVIDKLNAK